MKTAILTVLSFAATPVLCLSATIHVPAEKPTIQAAISAAIFPGDLVLVEAGTYVENIDFLGRSITVMSRDGPMATVIDGGCPVDPDHGSVVTFRNGETSDTALIGFTITNGRGSLGLEDHLDGGGIFCYYSSPTIFNNIIIANELDLSLLHFGSGGGMFNYHSNPWIDSCLFMENVAYRGGAMMNASCKPTVTNCTLVGNHAGQRGAGIYNYWGLPHIRDCRFINNASDYQGGGIYNLSSWPTIVNCSFTGNQALQGGGAVYAVVTESDFLMMNCTLVGNSSGVGAGMEFSFCSPTLINCTITNNTAKSNGGALKLNQSWPEVVNCVLWGNAPNEIAMNSTSDPVISYTCVQGGWVGTGNIDSDPLFVDGVEGDVHLLYPTPCRDTGDNSAVTELLDFEGNPRIGWGGTVDMGADEFYTHLYVTGDKTPGGSIEGKFIGLPGTTPVGLLVGSGILPTPANTMWGEYWLQTPWFLFTLVPIPSNGILQLPTTLPGSIPAPYDVPMQALIGLNADSLTKLCVLEVR